VFPSPILPDMSRHDRPSRYVYVSFFPRGAGQVRFLDSHPIAIAPRQHLISVMFIRCPERDRLRALVDEAMERMSDCAIESGRIAVSDPYSLTLMVLKNRFEMEKAEVERLRNSLESHRRDHGC
jgi:hypothetical protein